MNTLAAIALVCATTLWLAGQNKVLVSTSQPAGDARTAADAAVASTSSPIPEPLGWRPRTEPDHTMRCMPQTGTLSALSLVCQQPATILSPDRARSRTIPSPWPGQPHLRTVTLNLGGESDPIPE
jgi:hypothetical protein